MKATVDLDDDLVTDAEVFTGITERSKLIEEALRALIEREALRGLSRFGGTQPDLQQVPRRRSAA